MGIVRDIILGRHTGPIFEAAAEPGFVVDADAIPPAFYGLANYADPIAPAPAVTRRAAMQVPAVKKARDLVAGTLGMLPLDLVGPDGARVPSNLCDQPEASLARTVTMARTVEDMLLWGRSWWRVTRFAWTGYPDQIERLRHDRVSFDDDRRMVWVDGHQASDAELIRIESPNDPLLIAGARAIREALRLIEAAGADGIPPVDWFEPANGVDPADDDEVEELLDAWAAARRRRRTAYVPAALSYKTSGWSPEQLQLADQRQHAVLEIARAAGVDPEDLGVAISSRTYFNAVDRRKSFTDLTLGAYRQAVEDRLSMADVTPRGYRVRINLSEFLRSDDASRMGVAVQGVGAGIFTPEQGRDYFNPDTPVTAAPVTTPPTAQETPAMQLAPAPAPSFAGPRPRLTFDPAGSARFEVDPTSRTIRGLAVPYGVPATSMGQQFQFSQGTIELPEQTNRVKVLVGHEFSRAVGVATQLDDQPDGLHLTARIAAGPAGDEVLSMASDGVWDGLSIGIAEGGTWDDRGGVQHAVSVPLMEISVTPLPAFEEARIHAVAASAVPTDQGADGEQVAGELAGPAPEFSATVAAAIRDGFNALNLPPREVVAATGAGAVEISEPPVYRFDGRAGQRSLTEDLRAMQFGDGEARQHVDQFMAAAFATAWGDVSALNPTQNRPELYVPHLTYSRPLWESVTTGGLDDKTPFTIPKFASASGLVSDHTEGNEPTAGTFTATSQTVTPAPLSGKVTIDREVIDAGGSPATDQIIWTEILNAWYEAIEAKIAALLNASTTTETNLASAVDSALVAALTAKLASLQFVRGGNRFTGFVSDGLLFNALVAAKDGQGRPLLPVVGPANAQGSTAGDFGTVQLGAQAIRAAWALGATNASKSFLFVPSSVYAWSSTPQRFNFEYQVKSIDIAVWGYAATAITRDSDVLPIDYTTAD